MDLSCEYKKIILHDCSRWEEHMFEFRNIHSHFVHIHSCNYSCRILHVQLSFVTSCRFFLHAQDCWHFAHNSHKSYGLKTEQKTWQVSSVFWWSEMLKCFFFFSFNSFPVILTPRFNYIKISYNCILNVYKFRFVRKLFFPNLFWNTRKLVLSEQCFRYVELNYVQSKKQSISRLVKFEIRSITIDPLFSEMFIYTRMWENKMRKRLSNCGNFVFC